MKKVFAGLAAAAFVSGCSATVTWDENGIYDCHNIFNNLEVSFNTEETVRAVADSKQVSITVKDINTGHNIIMSSDEGWVCTTPSGNEWRFETEPS